MKAPFGAFIATEFKSWNSSHPVSTMAFKEEAKKYFELSEAFAHYSLEATDCECMITTTAPGDNKPTS